MDDVAGHPNTTQTDPKLLHDCGQKATTTVAEERRSANLNEEDGVVFNLTRWDFPECHDIFFLPRGRTSTEGNSNGETESKSVNTRPTIFFFFLMLHQCFRCITVC